MAQQRSAPEDVPVLLLDVDGVINASSPQWSVRPARANVRAGDISYPLRWAPQLVTELKSLRDDGLVELVWCTTWCFYADQLEKLWGIDPPLRRAFPGGAQGITSTAKIVAAREVLRSGRPLIWADDDAIPTHGPTHVELLEGNRTLLITPRSSVGLTPRHIILIREFCRRVREQ